MSQPMYTVLATSNAYANAGSQAERGFNRGYGNDAFITSTGGETANISPSTFSAFTSTGDQRLQYLAGRRLRILHGGASTDTTYCEVASAVLTGGSTATTVTIRNITAGATNLSTSAIAEVGISPVWASSSNGNLPQQFPYLSFGASTAVASVGLIRLTNNQPITARNAANSADEYLIDYNASNIIELGLASVSDVRMYGNLSVAFSNPATVGNLRLPNAGTLYQRNAANNADDQLLPLQTQESTLAGNITSIAITTAGTTVVGVVLTPGTWAISAQAQVASNSGAAKQIVGYISDGTTVEASAEIEATASNLQQVLSIPMGLITNATTSNSTYALRVYGSSSGVTVFAAVTLTGVGNNATRITAIRTGQ